MPRVAGRCLSVGINTRLIRQPAAKSLWRRGFEQGREAPFGEHPVAARQCMGRRAAATLLPRAVAVIASLRVVAVDQTCGLRHEHDRQGASCNAAARAWPCLLVV
jgi:hypothetical protein